ncbi:MAG: glycosyltransferase [Bacteroidetes bacterium]|nr:glycosyltransferase [Bacteroidota bacterium]
MNENLLISILVPSYRQGNYIEHTILSVLHQSYANWEMIIQDSCSPDQTAGICKRYAHRESRIKFFSEKDNGFADAVNRALMKSKGTIAIILNSDDFLSHRDVLKQASKHWNEMPRLNLLTAVSTLVDDQLTEIMYDPYQLSENRFIASLDIFRLQTIFPQSSTFFSITRAKEIGMLNTNTDMVADTEFWIRLANYKPHHEKQAYIFNESWSCVTIHDQQRGADSAKFMSGRAHMFVEFVKDERLDVSIGMRKKSALSFVVDAWEYFTAHGLDTQEIEFLYHELEGRSIPVKKKIKKLLAKNKWIRRQLFTEIPGNSSMSFLSFPRGKPMTWFREYAVSRTDS